MSKSIIAIVTAATGLVAAVIVGLLGCSSKQQGVVIYVSEDQVFSESRSRSLRMERSSALGRKRRKRKTMTDD